MHDVSVCLECQLHRQSSSIHGAVVAANLLQPISATVSETCIFEPITTTYTVHINTQEICDQYKRIAAVKIAVAATVAAIVAA